MGIVKANNFLSELFTGLNERNGNFFCRVIGADDDKSYNNELSYLNKKIGESNGLIFTSTIPLPFNQELTISILNELDKMDLLNLGRENIILVDDINVNNGIMEALEVVVPLAIENEVFPNKNISHNFVAKLMIWANEYINKLKFNGTNIPKCIFYGDIKRHEVYFLILLALIGVDVIYLNPLNDLIFESIDNRGFSQIIRRTNMLEIGDYAVRVSKGEVIEKITTYAKKASNELEDLMYTNTGIYKPWQFIDGTTEPVIINSIIEDMLTYWEEPAKLRPGFKVENKKVYVPTFFNKVSGVYKDLAEYGQLINKLKKGKHTVFINGTVVQEPRFTTQQMYSLAFSLYSDNTINKKEIKNHELYKNLNVLSAEVQNFILDKIDKTLSYKSYFNFDITPKERLMLLATVLTMDIKYIDLFESFDYTGDIPKIVIYINNRNTFTIENTLFLSFFNEVGFDIVILTTSGISNIEQGISTNYVNVIRLEDMVFDLDLDNKELYKQEKESLLKRLFG